MDLGMKRYLWVICILSMIVLVNGCIYTDQNNPTPHNNPYVVVREIIRENGTVISGYDPWAYDPFLRNNTYDTDMYNRSIRPYSARSGSNPNNVKILLYVYKYTDTPDYYHVEQGADVLIYDPPYTLQNGLVMTGFDNNGTLELLFNNGYNNPASGSIGNSSISIHPGDSWTSPVVSIWNDTENTSIPPPNTIIDQNVTNYTYTIQHVFSYTIENLGVFD